MEHVGDSLYPPRVAARRLKGEWRLGLFREAGEAVGSFHGVGGGGAGGSVWEDDPDRVLVEAVRRARGQVRRYCVANGLNRFGTLTYGGEGCHDPRQVRGDLARFFRRLRRGLGGEPFPYLWVPELHPGGHGFHAHFVVGQFVRRGLIEEAWGQGFVHITLIGDLPVGAGVRGEARVAARYVSKYLGKGMAGTGGLNRYDVAQGFQPKAEGIFGQFEEDVVEEAWDRMGGPPAFVWRSVGVEGWRGPRAVFLSWD